MHKSAPRRRDRPRERRAWSLHSAPQCHSDLWIYNFWHSIRAPRDLAPAEGTCATFTNATSPPCGANIFDLIFLVMVVSPVMRLS